MQNRRWLKVCVLFVTAAVVAETSWGQTVTRVSVASSGSEADLGSLILSISAAGRHVAFGSEATNLVAGDSNGVWDVFVHDRLQRSTARVSVDSSGQQANGLSQVYNSISAEGRFVAYASFATNLVAGDSNGVLDVFVHDRDADGNGIFDEAGGVATERVSRSTTGQQGDGDSWVPALSGNGRFVAFQSSATNLVPGDSNGLSDIFVHDRLLQTTRRVSVSSTGVEANQASFIAALSEDGTVVSYLSYATNLVANDSNGHGDIFVHHLAGGVTERVSVDSAGVEANGASSYPSLSANGQLVAFESFASNLVANDQNPRWDIFVHDRSTGTTSLVSKSSSGVAANDSVHSASLSADGRWVSYASLASNLVPQDSNGQPDVFLHDRTTAATIRTSRDSQGVQAIGPSSGPRLSANGRYVAFQSGATNLISGDLNGEFDAFVHDRIEAELVGTPQNPQPIHFALRNAAGEAGQLALFLFSCTGFGPTPLGAGRDLPLTVDSCTAGGLAQASLFVAPIDLTGSAVTTSLVFPSLPLGLSIHYAAVTFLPGSAGVTSITGARTLVTQ
jgi:hypothetical protein